MQSLSEDLRQAMVHLEDLRGATNCNASGMVTLAGFSHKDSEIFRLSEEKSVLVG